MQRERLRLAKVKGEVKQQHCREELQLLRWSAPPLWANLTSNTIFYRTKATEASPHSGNFPVITLKHWFVHQYANKAPWNTTIFSKSMSLNFFLFCRILSWNFLFKSRIFSLPFEPLISRWRPSIDTMTTWCISPSYNETHDNITHANPVWSKANLRLLLWFLHKWLPALLANIHWPLQYRTFSRRPSQSLNNLNTPRTTKLEKCCKTQVVSFELHRLTKMFHLGGY